MKSGRGVGKRLSDRRGKLRATQQLLGLRPEGPFADVCGSCGQEGHFAAICPRADDEETTL